MAVYTHLSDTDLVALLAKYKLGALVRWRGIAEGVENSNYLLDTSSGRYILTVYEKRTNIEELPFFLNLMEHLAGQGIPCPVPVHDAHGEVLQQIHGKAAAIVTFLEGQSVRRIQNVHCAALGEWLAHMHIAAESFAMERVNTMGISHWRQQANGLGEQVERFRTGIRQEIAYTLADIEARWPAQLPSGVIHADLFPDNVFFQGQTLSGIIDYYFACTDMFVYDLAICMNAWCFEPTYEFNITKAGYLLRAYHTVRPLSDEEMRTLPVLCTGAAMRFFLSRLHDWLHPVEGALVTPKDPAEYLTKVRFHMQVKTIAEYGL
ncbi:MAG: homoserine kinase [Hyphomicrobiales bacterium]|nr:homoserine kinase [Hyphomicrobiales bacterium]